MSSLTALTSRHRIGPVDLTQGTVTRTGSVLTVVDNLFAQGKIHSESISISYAPTTTANAANGEITFGDTDSAKYALFLFDTNMLTGIPSQTGSLAS
jgi:hypothetical protein